MHARAPGIAVVIPSYQQAVYLPEAIESVLAQTEPAAEVLVVDDGSTDGTEEVAARFPVRYLRRPNGGVSAARNTGVAATSSPLIVFLDADDRLHPGALASQRACLEREPAAAIVAGICRIVDSDGAPVGHDAPYRCPGGDHYDALLRHNHIWPPAAAMHRRAPLLDAGGWPERYAYFEDVSLYLEVARRHRIACHPDLVCDYRRHAEGVSNNRAGMLDGIASVLRDQETWVRANPQYAEALAAGREAYLSRWGAILADAVRDGWRRRDWRRMTRGLRSLAKHYPAGLSDLFGRKLRSLAGRRTA